MNILCYRCGKSYDEKSVHNCPGAMGDLSDISRYTERLRQDIVAAKQAKAAPTDEPIVYK